MTPDAARAQLLEPWRHGEHFDGRGAEIDGPIDIAKKTVRGFDLSGARLAGIDARGAVMRGIAWLENARVAGAIDFSDATFRLDLRAKRLRAASVDLRGATMQGVLDLDGAEIDMLRLDGAVLLANVSLAGAKIGSVGLSGATAMGGVWAHAAKVGAIDNSNFDVEGRIVGEDAWTVG